MRDFSPRVYNFLTRDSLSSIAYSSTVALAKVEAKEERFTISCFTSKGPHRAKSLS